MAFKQTYILFELYFDIIGKLKIEFFHNNFSKKEIHNRTTAVKKIKSRFERDLLSSTFYL